MTILDMLEQSGVLTLLGMGIVFGFLVTMVICVSIMGKVIGALEKKNGSGEPKAEELKSPAAAQSASTNATAAAITAAVHQYQKNNS